jgi:hypothetical protein
MGEIPRPVKRGRSSARQCKGVVKIEARLGYVAALFNLLLRLAGTPSDDRMLPALAEFVL